MNKTEFINAVAAKGEMDKKLTLLSLQQQTHSRTVRRSSLLASAHLRSESARRSRLATREQARQ